jgi:hypothetical protein
MRASLELDEPISRHPALRVSSSSNLPVASKMVNPASLNPVGTGVTGPAAPNINITVTFFVLVMTGAGTVQERLLQVA